MNVILIALAYMMATAAVVTQFWRYRQGSPIFWFPLVLALMAAGTFALIDTNMESDVVYAAMFFVALVSFASGAAFCLASGNVSNAYRAFVQRPVSSSVPEERHVTLVVFTLSVIVVVLYYRAIGYNMFVELLMGDLDGSYSDLRLATYADTDVYLAAGYVNQFKNILLPLTSAALLVWTYQHSGRKMLYALSVFIVPLVLLSIAGTGQRAFVIYTSLSFAFGYVLHNTGRKTKINSTYIILSILSIGLVFGFMTGAYQGVQSEGSGAVADKALERFTSAQQESGLVGFRYIYAMDTVWFAEWWTGLRGIWPGAEGSLLSNEIHAIMYGSFRGTAPLLSLGSAYYNGGIVGVVLFFAILGGVYTYLYHRFLRGKRSPIRSLSYGFLFFYLAAYVVDSPVTLLDNGVVALIIFLLLIKIRVGSRPRLGNAGPKRIRGFDVANQGVSTR